MTRGEYSMMTPELAAEIVKVFESYTEESVVPECELHAALLSLGLDRYSDSLIFEHGFATLREIKELEVEDLVSFGMGWYHAQKLLDSIPTPTDCINDPRKPRSAGNTILVRPPVATTAELYVQPQVQVTEYADPCKSPFRDPVDEAYQQFRQNNCSPSNVATTPSQVGVVINGVSAVDRHSRGYIPAGYDASEQTFMPSGVAVAARNVSENVSTPRVGNSREPVRSVWDLDEAGWQVSCGGDAHDYVNWLKPCCHWVEAGFSPQLSENVLRKWPFPTPVQSILLGRLSDDRDMMVSGSTGSGKTGAYLLPILRKLEPVALSGKVTTFALILTHTVELASQVVDDMRWLSNGLPIRVFGVLGTSVNKAEQQSLYEKLGGHAHIVVGTIGRIRSILESARPFLDFSSVQHLVIDEADTIAKLQSRDQSMQGQLEAIFDSLPPTYHTTVVSATLFDELHRMLGFIHGYSGRPLVRPGAWMVTEEGKLENKARVDQTIYENVRKYDDRVRITARIIREALAAQCDSEPLKVLVFSKKDDAHYVAEDLEKQLTPDGIPVMLSTGDVPQQERLLRFDEVKRSQTPTVLVTSYGVCGQGVDMDVKLVVLFNMPENLRNYKHAIGRTGRRGVQGFSVAFYNRDIDERNIPVQQLKKLLEGSTGGKSTWI